MDTVIRTKPQPVLEGAIAGTIAGRGLERQVLSYTQGRSLLSDEGSYWTVFTIGTGIGLGDSFVLNSTYAETSPQLTLIPTIPQGVRIYLDYIRLLIDGAVAGVLHAAGRMDSNPRSYSLGASVSYLPTRANADVPPGGEPAILRQGDIGLLGMVPPTCRTVFRSCVSPQNLALASECLIKFGERPRSTSGNAAAGGRYVADVPPVVLGSGSMFTLHLWSNGSVAPTAEAEFGFWVR